MTANSRWYSKEVVPAPIVIDLVATPPPAPELARQLVATCASVAGGGGCALTGNALDPEVRARVVVTFDADYARVRVEMAGGTNAGRWREVTFRDGDPTPERFRSAGLVVAGLVGELEHGDIPPMAPSAPTPEAPQHSGLWSTESVALAAEGRIQWTHPRPWGGVALAATIPVARSRFFLAAAATYDHTLEASTQGISERRLALGAGGGVAVPLAEGRLRLRPRVEIALQEVGAEVRDPPTGRADSGGRFLVGLTGAIDVLVPVGPVVGIVGGADLAWLGDSTAVLVHDRVGTTIPAWMYGLVLGLDVRIP